MLQVADVLGLEGLVARRLERFEERPQQLQMAEAVAAAIAERRHLAVEAGTGVGKSFAYLVPAILAAANEQDEDRPRRIVVSTHTIALQEQLLTKDVPFLNSVLPVEFTAVLVKGRGNYLSLRRLKNARERANSLFREEEEFAALRRISAWAQATDDGSLGRSRPRPARRGVGRGRQRQRQLPRAQMRHVPTVLLLRSAA